MYAQLDFLGAKKLFNPFSVFEKWFKPTPDKLRPQEAVVMHADIVDSTNLVKKDFVLAHTKVEALYTRLCQVARFNHGRTLEMRGDAVIFHFPTAVDSIKAGQLMQATNFLLNNTRMGKLEPRVRIGISKGPIVVSHTVTGESVIRAQRLEQLAEPGEVVVDQRIRDDIEPGEDIALEARGTEILKGFSCPTEIYRVLFRPAAMNSPSLYSDARSFGPRRSLAV